MVGDGFDYKEYEAYVNSLRITTKTFQTWLKEFLLQQAQRVVRSAKLRSPVDTGAYRASWAIGSQKIKLKPTGDISSSGNLSVDIDFTKSQIADVSVVGNYLEVEISNGMEYASFIEYGHHSYPAQYVLTIAIDEVQNALPNRFHSEFKTFLKKNGVM